MRIIGLAGWSGSGKTTLLAKIIPRLVARGYTVSTVKHAHHGFDVDTPGKDSHTHRMAGATEVLVASSRRWAVMHELRDEPEPSIYDLLQKMSPVDLVLIEGFKSACHTRIEVDDRLLEPLRASLWEQYGFTTNLDHFALFGICPDCSESKVQSPKSKVLDT